MGAAASPSHRTNRRGQHYNHASMTLPPSRVPSSVYTDDYYLSLIDGAAEFQAHHGRLIPRHIEIALREAELAAGMQTLDLGCGAGELLTHLRRNDTNVLGLDYSPAALRVARNSLTSALGADALAGVGLALSDGRRLPLRSQSVDRVFMLDVIEHMSPSELHAGLMEIGRVLAPGGKLIIHTMPNTWYYAVGYPLFRVVQRLRGVHLPRNPRNRFALSDTHINEQNPLRLASALRRAGFRPKVWLENARRFDKRESNRLMVAFMRALTSLPILKLAFCNDLFAVALPQDR